VLGWRQDATDSRVVLRRSPHAALATANSASAQPARVEAQAQQSWVKTVAQHVEPERQTQTPQMGPATMAKTQRPAKMLRRSKQAALAMLTLTARWVETPIGQKPA